MVTSFKHLQPKPVLVSLLFLRINKIVFHQALPVHFNPSVYIHGVISCLSHLMLCYEEWVVFTTQTAYLIQRNHQYLLKQFFISQMKVSLRQNSVKSLVTAV